MRASRAIAAVVVLALGLAVAEGVAAQYGHPLKGSWSGDWGPNDADRTRVLLVMDWDGTAVTGTLNPGRDGVPLSVQFDPATWGVRLEAEAKNADGGGMVHYEIVGTLENLGSPNRQISGTWMQGSQQGTFLLKRN